MIADKRMILTKTRVAVWGLSLFFLRNFVAIFEMAGAFSLTNQLCIICFVVRALALIIVIAINI